MLPLCHDSTETPSLSRDGSPLNVGVERSCALHGAQWPEGGFGEVGLTGTSATATLSRAQVW